MTTGRINQVATVGARSNRRRTQNPGPTRLFSHTHVVKTIGRRNPIDAGLASSYSQAQSAVYTDIDGDGTAERPDLSIWGRGSEAVFSRLPNTLSGDGILETVKLLQHLDA